MWYLLVAAGAGYFATKWQSGQKPRALSAENGQASCPSSLLNTPYRESASSESDATSASAKVILPDISCDSYSLGRKPCGDGLHSGSERDIAIGSLEIMANKRTACEVSLRNPSSFCAESNVPHVFTSKYSRSATDNVIKKEKQLESDLGNDAKLHKYDLSSSPSSSCSSSSTVINSPVDIFSTSQKDNASLKVPGKESGSQPTWQNGVFHFQAKGQEKNSNGWPIQAPTFSLNGNLSRESPRGVPIKSQKHQVDSSWSNETISDCVVLVPELNASATAASTGLVHTETRMGVDADINASLTTTRTSQRNDPRSDYLPDEYSCTSQFRFNAKQGSSPQYIRRKIESPSCNEQSKRSADNLNDASGAAFVSFGLAMAVCFMVSSSKKEMEKMGKVLRETEDLVSDMRKELEERKLFSSMDGGDTDEFFTIKPGDEIYQQGCTSEAMENHMDLYTRNRTCWYEDQSARSNVVENSVKKRYAHERYKDDSENMEIECEREDKHVGKGRMDSKCQSDFCGLKEESDSEGCEDDFTMSMIELERKLWQVFQERQEERILELEASLEVALSSLHSKEEELHWWKNRAYWLMQQSFGSTSDKVWSRSQLQRLEGFDLVNENGIETVSQRSSSEIDLQNQLQSLEAFDFQNEDGVDIEFQLLSNEATLPIVEGCVEAVGVEGSLALARLPKNGLVRTGSSSIRSAESGLSTHVNEPTHPLHLCNGNLQPRCL